MAEAPPEMSEMSCEELSKLSKAERTAYHQARLSAPKAQSNTTAAEGLSKAERRTAAREKQEQDRKRKDAATRELDDIEQALAELTLQGLTEEQARVVLAQIAEADAADHGDDEDDEADESLIHSVRNWMAVQAKAPSGDEFLMRDFNLKVRFQGHVDTTPPCHLSAVLHVLASQTCLDIDVASPSKQPSEVSAIARPRLAKWAFVVEQLYRRCDALDILEILASSVQDGIADGGGDLTEDVRSLVLVGFFMAVREELEFVEDTDVLAGLHQLESESKVIQKFVDFLQAEIDGSDESESNSEGS